MTLVKLKFRPYIGNQVEWHGVDATIRGDLAVHRPATLRPECEGGGLSFYGKEWTISHIPSGDSVQSACPAAWRDRGAFTARKRDLLAWAEYHQAACPAFYDAARRGDKEAMAELVGEALNAGKAFEVAP